MKTNQILVRRMGDFEVLQRTNDGMFNATALLRQWNSVSRQKKQMSHYSENASTEEFITALMTEENLSQRNSVIMKSKANKGKNVGTWMHPFLFIDFAMWLNPSFKLKVIKFVSDELIKYRNDAGDAYKELSSAVMSLVGKDQMQEKMKEIAKALNHIVFGKHESGMRNNSADERQMRELFELEKKIASLINEGFIASYRDLISYLRKLWTKKWQPPMLRDIEIPARMS